MTEEEFLAIPEDNIDRWWIGGEVKDWGPIEPSRFHSAAMTQLCFAIANWNDSLPGPRGQAYAGGVGIRLPLDPPVIVGADLAYLNPIAVSKDDPKQSILNAAPTLAVEILSPSDTNEQVLEKTRLYLRSGTSLVWIVDPEQETVLVYRSDSEPILFNSDQELTAEPIMPGFKVAVADLFE